MKRLELTLGFAGALALGLSWPLLAAAAPGPYDIALLERTIAPAAGVDRALLEGAASRAAASPSGTAHLLVQLYDVPDILKRTELERRGLDLGSYVSGNAWMAAMPSSEVRGLALFSEVRYALPWTAEHKLHPRVKKGDFGSWTRSPEHPGWVMLFVLLHHDVRLDRLDAIAAAVGGVALEPLASLHGGTLWAPENRFVELAEIEDVLWVEEGPPPLSPSNDGIRAATRTTPLFSAPYGLDGSGVKLFVYDGGTVRTTHQTFDAGAGSRVTLIDGTWPMEHSTHVAGTAAGDGSGSSGGRGRGIATGATVYSAGYQQITGSGWFWDNAGDIDADYALARNTYKVDLGNNSLGANVAPGSLSCTREGDYGVAASLLDELVRGEASAGGSMILAWAAGNERDGVNHNGRCGAAYQTMAPPSCAKNPIQVAAVNSDGLSMTDFSGWGPCDDGRLKPIVAAPGCEQGRVTGETDIYSSLGASDSSYGGEGWCGTSMATPAVAGILSLFLEDWPSVAGIGKARPLPALVKAFLIETARDLGQPGPDYVYGYGEVDAKALIDTLRAGTGTLGTSSAPVVWGTDLIAHGASQSRRWAVPAGTGELKASLAWDDPAASAFTSFAPVNNLTLQLISPSGVTHNAFILFAATPWEEAGTGLNAIDNQEQVLVKNPEPGTWSVRVTGTNVPVGPQAYGLVYAAKARTYDPETCSTVQAGFETGTDFFVTSGAGRNFAPAAGHGSFSLQLGGITSTVAEAYRSVSIPAGATRAVLTYHVYQTTAESLALDGFHHDHLIAEIRNSANVVQAVVDSRSDGWKAGVWMRQFEVDLTPWASQTVRIAFRAENDGFRPTTYWVDDFAVQSCSP